MRSALLVAGLVLGLLSASVVDSVAAEPEGGVRASATCRPVAIAHRGLSAGMPENTLRAFRKALRTGARVLETDIRFTSDGVAVLMHDPTVDRTTDGHGRVASLTYRQVSRLDAGDGARVPRLKGLVALAHRRGARLLAELKAPRADRREVRTALHLIRSGGMGPRTTVQSFSRANVVRVHRMAPRMRTALIIGQHGRLQVPDHRGIDAVVPQRSRVTRNRVRRWHRAGLDVYAWTANRRAAWRRLDRAGVDAVITNRPRAYLHWARRSCH